MTRILTEEFLKGVDGEKKAAQRKSPGDLYKDSSAVLRAWYEEIDGS